MLGHFNSGYALLGLLSCYVRLGKVISGCVRLGQVRPG